MAEMSDDKLEEIRREQIICAQQIIKAISALADAVANSPNNLMRHAHFDALIRELPQP